MRRNNSAESVWMGESRGIGRVDRWSACTYFSGGVDKLGGYLHWATMTVEEKDMRDSMVCDGDNDIVGYIVVVEVKLVLLERRVTQVHLVGIL